MVGRAVRGALTQVKALRRSTGAAADDFAHAIDVLGLREDSRPDDWLDKRDPDYIRDNLPNLRLMSKTWFRAEVEGLENIPAEGPVLLVGNHSGGTWIADTFVFAQAFYDHFGPQRVFHQLAHDLVFKVAGLRELAVRYGTVPANPENMRRALDRDAALLVYPGGDHESFRPSWETAKVDFAEREGWVRLALDLGVPVVPIVAIGGQETALFLGQGTRIARALRLDKLMRLKVVPAQVGPPLGFTVLDLPIRVPLPAKIAIRVLEPVDLRERLGPEPEPREGYDLVTNEMQQTLDELADERRLPVVG